MIYATLRAVTLRRWGVENMGADRLNQGGYVTTLIPDHVSDLHYSADMPAEEERLQRFGELIRTTRETMGWTQDDLAEAAGVSRPTINRYEQGKTHVPEPPTARSIFRALKLDPRRIPVVLGYVSAEELGLPADGPRSFDNLTETAIQILEDPTVSAEEKEEWIEYLRFRMQRNREKRRRAG